MRSFSLHGWIGWLWTALLVDLTSSSSSSSSSPPASSASSSDASLLPATTASTHDKISSLLDDLTRRIKMHHATNSTLPFVTVTYAQSVDGKMALKLSSTLADKATSSTSCATTNTTTSSNLAISGAESLLLTHALRSRHDAILIGKQTWIVDNPRLSNRLWKSDDEQIKQQQPRPIIVDTHLTAVRRYLEQQQKSSQNHQQPLRLQHASPIVCCTAQAASTQRVPPGWTVLPCCIQQSGQLDLRHVLQQLRQVHGIQSVMVEGGPSIITSLLLPKCRCCHLLCITVAPVWMGRCSVGPTIEYNHAMKLPVRYERLGRDMVVWLALEG